MRAWSVASHSCSECMHCSRVAKGWACHWTTYANSLGHADTLSVTRQHAPLAHRSLSTSLINDGSKTAYGRASCGVGPRFVNVSRSTSAGKTGTAPVHNGASTAAMPLKNSKTRFNTIVYDSNRAQVQPVQDESTREIRHESPLLHADHDTMRFESGLVDESSSGRLRLIEQPKTVNNFQLWYELFVFRSRFDGSGGVRHLWRQMRKRTDGILTTGHAADRLWTLITKHALEDREFLEEVTQDAEEIARNHARTWDCLYDRVVGHMLGNSPQEALGWHERLAFTAGGPRQVRDIITGALSSAEALGCLGKICRTGKAPKLYDSLIPALCGRGDLHAARLWHDTLLSLTDLPSSTSQTVPAVEREMMSDRLPTYHWKRPVPKVSHDTAVKGRVRAKTQPTEFEGVHEKVLNDEFLARVFATKSLGLYFLLHSVGTFGSRKLGPLAMQQMALRCGTVADFQACLDIVVETKVEIIPHVFSQVVELIAQRRLEPVFQAIRKSDMHPDAYEDIAVQRQLLRQYLHQGKQLDVQRTLIILETIEEGDSDAPLNNLATAYFDLGQYAKLWDLVEDGLGVGHRLTQGTLAHMVIKYLTGQCHWMVEKRSDPLNVKLLYFLTQMLLRVATAGGEVSGRLWSRLMPRFGFAGRLKDQENLATWLADFYGRSRGLGKLAPSKSLVDTDTAPGSTTTEDDAVEQAEISLQSKNAHPMQYLFHARAVRQIIAASFTASAQPRDDRHVPWLRRQTVAASRIERKLDSYPDYMRGLALIRMLRVRYKIPIYMLSIRRIVQQRLVQLYGAGWSSLPRNRRARIHNTVPFVEAVRRMHRLWDDKLFDVPSEVVYGDSPRHVRALRGALLGPQRSPPTANVRFVIHRGKQARVRHGHNLGWWKRVRQKAGEWRRARGLAENRDALRRDLAARAPPPTN